MSNESFNLADRAKSFTYAFDGIATLIRNEHNAWIHAAATVVVTLLGLWLEIGRTNFAILIVAMGTVWLGESVNTAVEAVVDMAADGKNPLAKVAKDTAAGGVLLAAICAALAGLLILGPPLLDKLFG